MSNFDSWWQLWPPGTKKGKDAARKWYVSRVKIIQTERPDEDAHELLQNGLTEYLMSKTVAKGFIMHPATWLRGGHWQDDPDRSDKFQDQFSKSKRVSCMDDTTRQEMARARQLKAQRTPKRPTLPFSTKSFDRGWQPPKGSWIPMGDPVQADKLRERRERYEEYLEQKSACQTPADCV